MALTVEESDYVKTHHLRRITFDGVNDLYLSLTWGSYTVAQMIEQEKVKAAWSARSLKPKSTNKSSYTKDEELMLLQLENRNERCIDTYGCGTF